MKRHTAITVAASLLVIGFQTPAPAGGLDALKQLSGFVDDADDLLPPEQAFAVSLSVRDASTLVATFTPAPGYYLYRDRFVFRVRAPADIKVARIDWPRGEIKEDAFFGKTEIFRAAVSATVRLDRRNNAAARKLALHVTYQGCNEPIGVCYLPIDKTLDASLPALLTLDAK